MYDGDIKRIVGIKFMTNKHNKPSDSSYVIGTMSVKNDKAGELIIDSKIIDPEKERDSTLQLNVKLHVFKQRRD